MSLIDRILHFNADRLPEGLRLKYLAMSQDPFIFFRGTCHLFYEDLPKTEIFQNAPLAWICGDLHLQNFGSFKGNDWQRDRKNQRKLVYFDINDFDESVLAPCSWDLSRFLVSLQVADLGLDRAEIQDLSAFFLKIYGETLACGKAGSIHRETAQGVVKDLLEDLKSRKRKDFIDRRIDRKTRTLKCIPQKTTEIPQAIAAQIRKLVNVWAKTHAAEIQTAHPNFFNVLDVTHRIAGTGSLGLERYLILVEGKGYPEESYLLDLKEARSSSLQPYLQNSQPIWKNEADRIVSLQSRIQDSPPALLSAIASPEKSYVLRELQPTADKIDLITIANHPKRIKKLIETLAKITAWDQLRSGGRQGSAIADELMNFGLRSDWQGELLDYARQSAEQVRQDYQEFYADHHKRLK